MQSAFATDEDTPVTTLITQHLRDLGHEVDVVAQGAEWPEVGRAVAEQVAAGRAERGVVCCWTGTGVSIAANKVTGVRAALCPDADTARGARRWNDANVVALGLRLTSAVVAVEILDAFLGAEVDPDEQEAVARVELARGLTSGH